MRKAVVLAENHMDKDDALLSRLRESHRNALQMAVGRRCRPQLEKRRPLSAVAASRERGSAECQRKAEKRRPLSAIPARTREGTQLDQMEVAIRQPRRTKSSERPERPERTKSSEPGRRSELSCTAVAMARPILGTMTFGAEGQVKPEEASVLLRSFVGAAAAKGPQGVMIDTARIYQNATPDGDTETTLGQIFQSSPSIQKRCHLATKATPQFTLSKKSIIEQCNVSLSKLGVDCLDLFYLHGPDVKTDMNDTLDGIEALHKEGKFKEFGLSNYPAWAVVDIWYRCKNRGMVLPTVYQGAYNVITRDMEREIVPVARHFGLRLYMYNPLAGGLLSGRYKTQEDILTASSGRFSSEFDKAFGTSMKAGTDVYRQRYAHDVTFKGLGVLLAACAQEPDAPCPTVVEDTTKEVDGRKVRLVVSESVEKAPPKGPSLAEVALRWLIHHSYLTSCDGIIIGASKNEHLVANLAAWQAGPLPKHLLEACEEAWSLARPACESYFRGYGKRPGGIEQFLALQVCTARASEKAQFAACPEPEEPKGPPKKERLTGRGAAATGRLPKVKAGGPNALPRHMRKALGQLEAAETAQGADVSPSKCTPPTRRDSGDQRLGAELQRALNYGRCEAARRIQRAYRKHRCLRQASARERARKDRERASSQHADAGRSGEQPLSRPAPPLARPKASGLAGLPGRSLPNLGSATSLGAGQQAAHVAPTEVQRTRLSQGVEQRGGRASATQASGRRRAALKIQAAWARFRQRLGRSRALLLQGLVRASLQLRQLSEQMAAARRIQRCYRRHWSKAHRSKSLKERASAATQLQASWRGVLQRRVVQQKRQEQQLCTDSATKLQSLWRGHSGRQKSRQEQASSATKLQSRWRGHQQRRIKKAAMGARAAGGEDVRLTEGDPGSQDVDVDKEPQEPDQEPTSPLGEAGGPNQAHMQKECDQISNGSRETVASEGHWEPKCDAWSCHQCGLVNEVSPDICVLCERPRERRRGSLEKLAGSARPRQR
ncbi:unnamed protein product [Effrenium voratum]|nr:unnamed protein product [Effrenium voratum]